VVPKEETAMKHAVLRKKWHSSAFAAALAQGGTNEAYVTVGGLMRINHAVGISRYGTVTAQGSSGAGSYCTSLGNWAGLRAGKDSRRTPWRRIGSARILRLTCCARDPGRRRQRRDPVAGADASAAGRCT
jgi:hypothetical protein